MVIAMFLAVLLAISTFLFHFAVLRWLSGSLARVPMTNGIRILVIVLAILAAHVVEVLMYAGAFTLAVEVVSIGGFGGRGADTPLDYLYFSIVSFTSLGLGDVYPLCHLRLLTGIEALNGLLLIAWSGSFIYTAMERLWPWEPCAQPQNRKTDK